MNFPPFQVKKIGLTACIVGAFLISLAAFAASLIANLFSSFPLTAKPKGEGSIKVVSLENAKFLHGQDVLFVDARTPDLFAESHIPGAVNLDYFDFDNFFGPFSEKNKRTSPLLVYCEGISGDRIKDTCQTSRLLAQNLIQTGYTAIYLFEGGFSHWKEARLPVEGSFTGSPASMAHRTIPHWNYIRDIGALALGFLLLLLRKKKGTVILARLLLGCVFILGASGKLFAPEKMAIILQAYRILPESLVPVSAVFMPWLECAAGIALIAGVLSPSGALIVCGLNLFYVPALAYRTFLLSHQLGISLFQVNFDCGCGLGENFAWALILRDVGFLLMGMAILAGTVRKTLTPSPLPVTGEGLA